MKMSTRFRGVVQFECDGANCSGKWPRRWCDQLIFQRKTKVERFFEVELRASALCISLHVPYLHDTERTNKCENDGPSQRGGYWNNENNDSQQSNCTWLCSLSIPLRIFFTAICHHDRTGWIPPHLLIFIFPSTLSFLFVISSRFPFPFPSDWIQCNSRGK